MTVTSTPVPFSIDAVARPPQHAPPMTTWGAISDMLTALILGSDMRANGRGARVAGLGGSMPPTDHPRHGFRRSVAGSLRTMGRDHGTRRRNTAKFPDHSWV